MPYLDISFRAAILDAGSGVPGSNIFDRSGSAVESENAIFTYVSFESSLIRSISRIIRSDFVLIITGTFKFYHQLKDISHYPCLFFTLLI